MTTDIVLGPRRAPGVVPAGTGVNDPIIVQVLQGPSGVQWKINRQSAPDLKDLATRLGSIFQGRAEKVVFFKANGSVAYSDVIEAIDAIFGSGIDKVGIIMGNIE